MKTTIDAAGRVVIPKVLRDEVGLVAGEVEIVRDGAGIRLQPVAGAGFEVREGRMVIPEAGVELSDDVVRALQDADRA